MLHRCHDYRYLSSRWRTLARAANLRVYSLCVASGMRVFFLRSPALEETGGIYLSAGVHGDEPGATEGLLAWAERNASRLATLPLLIFPCLNPWGLTHNRRTDEAGVDLNRCFHEDEHPTVAAVRRIAGKMQFSAALMLHEDYDAEGIYLYEIHSRELWGGRILDAASREIACDPRTRIEGRKATKGLLAPRFSPSRFNMDGYPEAVWLYINGCKRSLTFETPSEFAIEKRIAAQAAAIDAMLQATNMQM
jgi:murein peptide amidase A